MATSVEEPPLLVVVKGHVATWTKAPVRLILHHARDHRHIWGDNVSNDANWAGVGIQGSRGSISTVGPITKPCHNCD